MLPYVRLLLLPGMDGGARLLTGLCERLPGWIAPEILAYPSDTAATYGELEALVRARLASAPGPVALLAESFSGPIAIRVAADPPSALRAVILVATFAAFPRTMSRLAPLVGAWLFLWPPPAAALRRTLLARDSDPSLVAAAREAIAAVPSRVLAARAREALRADVREELARIALPLCYVAATRDRLLGGPRVLTRFRPDLRVERVEGPHLILEHAPAASAEVVARFLSEVAT
ncbi:MAG: alpha/beta hydrolase [Sandaracinaceae bacterium]|nr:alpha/beta hydrolase [Sandaracinaceae bacterium]